MKIKMLKNFILTCREGPHHQQVNDINNNKAHILLKGFTGWSIVTYLSQTSSCPKQESPDSGYKCVKHIYVQKINLKLKELASWKKQPKPIKKQNEEKYNIMTVIGNSDK
jgi:hypothetical protein